MKIKRLIAALTVFCLLFSNVTGVLPVAHATEVEEHGHEHETHAVEETAETEVLLSEEAEPETEETTQPAEEEAELLETEEYPAIEPGVEAHAVISTSGEIAYFSFVPEVTDVYVFTSVHEYDIDSYGYLYDSNLNLLDQDDDGAGNGCFQITRVLEKDVQYYFGAKFLSSSTTGGFPVHLEYGHAFTRVVTTEPTCTESGVATLTCDYCGHTTTETIDPDHTFGEVVVDAEPTCNEDGQSHYSCTVCGYTESWPVSKLGHDFEDGACTRCEMNMSGFPVLGVGEELTADIATASEIVFFRIMPDADEYYKINSIGDVDTVAYLYDSDMNQLTYNDNGGDGYNFALYRTIYAGDTYYLGVMLKDPNATGSVTVTMAAQHSYYSQTTTAATCTSEGVRTYTCNYCTDSYTETIPKANHTYTDGVCTVCGVDFLADKTQIQLDTRFNTPITEPGQIYYYYFTPEVTDYYAFYSEGDRDTYAYLYDANMNRLAYNDDGGNNSNFHLAYTLNAGETYVLGVKYYNTSYTGTIPVYLITEHSFTSEEKTPATCTENGVALLSCQYCDYSVETIIEAAHSWGEIVVTQEATCTTSGVYGWTCTVCGAVETWNTSALGHSLTDGICTKCNVDVVSQLPALTLNTPAPAEITQMGQYVYYTFTPEVTERYTYYSTGSSDVRGFVYDTDWNLLASDSYGDDDVNFRVYGVELEAGKTYIMAAKMRDSETVSGTFSLRVEVRHAYEEAVETEATCTEQGVDRYTCVYCGDNYTEVIYPHHTYGEEEIVTEPTCTQMGVMKSVCTRCGVEETWNISALGHSFTGGVCDVCGLDVLGSAVTIYQDVETSAEITTAGEYKYFIFTPSQTEGYYIYSTGSMDTYGYLYDEDFNELVRTNWGGNNQNFGIEYPLTGGQTYMIGVRSYDEEAIGSFGIKVEVSHSYYGEVTTPNTCTTAGVITFTCVNCGDSFTQEIAPAHTWGAGAVCSRCNEVMPVITLDESVTAVIANGGDKAYFQFTPDADEGYIFRSNSPRLDPYATLYDLNMNELEYSDDERVDGEYNVNFGLQYEMTAGTTYILEVSLYDEDTGSFPVTVSVSHAYEGVETTPSTCTADGVLTYTCKYCDDSYTDVSYARHDFSNGSSCSVCGMAMTLSGQCGDDLTWEINLGEWALIIEGSGPMWDFEGVAPWSHLWYQIESVNLPEGLTSISDYAFANLRYLWYISIPKSVTSIGNYFVSGCNDIQELRFNGAAPTFAENAFGGAKLYAYYPQGDPTWTNGVCKNYGGNVTWQAFSYMVGEGTIDGVGYWYLYSSGYMSIQGNGDAMPDWSSAEATPWYQYASRVKTIELTNFTNIGSYAFAGMSALQHITIDAGVVTIGEHAFSNCESLNNVYFAGNAPDISYNAFYNTSAFCSYDPEKTGWIPSVLQNYQGDLNWNASSNSVIAQGDYGDIYWEISSYGDLYIYGESAMPNEASASAYPWYAYKDQIRYVDVYCASIGTYAFQGYSVLEGAYLGEQVEAIGAKAFSGCTALEYIQFRCDAPTIAADAFENVVAEAGYHHLNETWTEEKRQNYGGQLEWFTYAQGIDWGNKSGIEWSLQDDGTLHIYGDDKAMFTMTSAEEYPWSAFADQVTRLYVNCATISDYAFGSLSKLEKAYINSEVTSIGTRAFAGCGALNYVYFSSVAAPEIASDAFSGVTAQIAYDACADGWTDIVGSNFGGTLTWNTYNAVVASGTYGSVEWKLGKDKVLYLKGDNATMADKTAVSGYPWYSYRNSIAAVITEGVTRIAQYAFRGYTALEAVYMDEAIVGLGGRAFSDCSALAEVQFDGAAPNMAANAFLNDTVTIWYNQSKTGWAEMDFDSYYGTITWKPYGNPIPVYEVAFTSGSVSLAGDIGLNFYVTLSDDVITDGDAYMEFTYGNTVQRMYLHDAIVNTDANGVVTYRFSCPMAAKQMTEEVTAQMYVSAGAIGDPKVYSVKAYCDAAIPVYSQYAQYADLVALMKAMLNYGGYSQVNFGYKTDALANASLSDTSLPALAADMMDPYAHGQSGSESGISIQSVSLLLESTTTIRFYFKLDGTRDISTYNFYVDGAKVKPVKSEDGLYYVDKTNVAAKDLDTMTTVRVGGLNVYYCGLSYVRQVAVLYPTYYSAALVNTAKALYAYNQAANNYFS